MGVNMFRVLVFICVVCVVAGPIGRSPSSAEPAAPQPFLVQLATTTPVQLVPAPTSAPTACSTAGVMCFYNAPPAIFVLVLAQDPATGAAVSIEVADRFDRTTNVVGGALSIPFIPAPFGWAFADFVNACNAAPLHNTSSGQEGVAGALLFYGASTQSNSYNWVFMSHGVTRVDSFAQFIKCVPSDAAGTGQSGGLAVPVFPLYDDVLGVGSRNSLSLGPAAAIASAIAALNPDVQQTHQFTYSYATPAPGATAVPYLSQYAETHFYGYDTSAVLAGGALTGFTTGSALIFPGNNVGAQLKSAAQHMADDLFRKIQKCGVDEQAVFGLLKWSDATPIPATNPSPLCRN